MIVSVWDTAGSVAPCRDGKENGVSPGVSPGSPKPTGYVSCAISTSYQSASVMHLRGCIRTTANPAARPNETPQFEDAMQHTTAIALTLGLGLTLNLAACDQAPPAPAADAVTNRALEPLVNADFEVFDPVTSDRFVGGMVEQFECIEGITFTVNLAAISVSVCQGGVRYSCLQANAISYECINGEVTMTGEDVEVIDCVQLGECGAPEELPW